MTNYTLAVHQGTVTNWTHVYFVLKAA